MIGSRLLLPPALIVLLAGCTIAPPAPLEEDAAFAELGESLPAEVAESWNPPTLAVAPVRLAYREGAAKPHSDRTWDRPDISAQDLQERLQDLLRWSLLEWHQPSRERWPKREDWPLGFDRDVMQKTGLAEWKDQACEVAEDEGAKLVAQLEIQDARVSFVRRTGLWWVDCVLFLGVGVLPAVYVPDEVYALDLRVKFSILHARTRRELLSRSYEIHHEDTFNDFQRGWSVMSLLFLHEAFLESGAKDFGKPLRALLPYALKELEGRILEDLRNDLPKTLDDDRELLVRGDPKHVRTYALLVADDDPDSPWDEELPPSGKPGPLSAESDALALANSLRGGGTVQDKHLKLVLGAKKNARERIRSRLHGFGAAALETDRVLIYFSGYGTTTPAGEAALVLDGALLTLKELRGICREELKARPSVLFVLDTSFGVARAPKGRGRNYRWQGGDPGGAAPGPEFLGPLSDPSLRWTVVAAAAHDGVAYELPTRGQGLLTSCLVDALETNPSRGRGADADGDGQLSAGELWRSLSAVLFKQAQGELHASQVPQFLPVAARTSQALVGKVWSRPR